MAESKGPEYALPNAETIALEQGLDKPLGSMTDIPEDILMMLDEQLNVISAVSLDQQGIHSIEEFVVGKNILDVVPGLEGTDRYNSYLNVIKTGEPLASDGIVMKTSFGEVNLSVRVFKVGDGLGMMIKDISKREQMKEELDDAKQRYKAMFDNRIQMVYVNDENGRILDANDYAVETMGYTRDEMGTKSMVDLIHPDDIQRAMMVIEDIRSSNVMGKPIELRVIDKSGKIYWVETFGIPMINNADNYLALGIARDITEAKQVEIALRESEEKFRHLVEEMNDGYVVVQNSVIAFANSRSAEMFGYEISEVIGHQVADLMSNEAIKKVGSLYARRLRGEAVPQQYEITLEKKDGTECAVEFGVKTIDYAGMKAVSIVMRDATERKKMGDELQKREQTYRLMFESRLDGVLVVDAETMQTVIGNDAAAIIFGFDSMEDGIGMNPLEFIPPEDRDQVLTIMLEDMFEKDLRQVNEVRAITKDGRDIWISALGTRMEYEGRLVGLISVRDITERKQAEQDKQRMEEQLRLAGRLTAVGELAAGVAHELNNPLAAVQAFAELLASRKDLDESTKSDVNTIYQEALRASRITTNLLSFARRHKPEKRLVSINNVLEKSLELHTYRMKVNNIEILKEFDNNLPLTMADFHHLQQVFVNIITNAEQAMTEANEKGKLIVRTEDLGDSIRITFADNGPGIPEEDMKRVFDPFFTTKEVGQGTGLGLSICYGLIQGHDGISLVKDTPGGGATFVIEIPVVTEYNDVNDVTDIIQI